MVDGARRRVSYAEYVAIANDAGVKYEYVEGEIHAMAGGSVAHARLIARITGILDRALEGRPCIVMPSDMRVRIRAADRATYPRATRIAPTSSPRIAGCLRCRSMSSSRSASAASRSIAATDGAGISSSTALVRTLSLDLIPFEVGVDDVYVDRLGTIV